MSPEESNSKAVAAPAASVEALRAELDASRSREREIAKLLGSESPDLIVHDLRNLLNELQLLRIISSEVKKQT